MATLRVRYKTGESEEWDLHETTNMKDLANHLWNAMPGGKITSFRVATIKGDTSLDFGFICLRWDEVKMWELDGILDEEALQGVWDYQDQQGE